MLIKNLKFLGPDDGNGAANGAAPAAEPAAKGGSEILSPEEISDILSFDPFAADGDTPEETGGEVEEEEVSASAPEPGSEEEEGMSALAAAAPAPASAEMEQLRLQNQWLQQQMERFMASPPAPQKGTEAPTAPAVPDYGFTIPPQLMQLLDSEDAGQRAQGLQYFAQGVAQTVHRTLMAEVKSELGKQAESVPRTIASAIDQRTQAQEIFRDFYGTYPELNNPALYSLVQSVATQVMQTKRGPWGPQIRDEVGKAVYGVLGRAMPTKANGAGKRKVPATVGRGGGGAVRAPADGGNNSAKDIDSTLFGN